MIFLLLMFSGYALAQEPTPSSTVVSDAMPSAPSVTEEDEDYEVDYEEEGDLPPPKKARNKNLKPEDIEASNSGSRAKNRFSSPAKSETKSRYKKNGVTLEVDTD